MGELRRARLEEVEAERDPGLQAMLAARAQNSDFQNTDNPANENDAHGSRSKTLVICPYLWRKTI